MITGNEMDNSWIPDGIDKEIAFRIEVKIEGFWNKQSVGRKTYYKGRTIQWVVDSDKFSMCDLNSDLLEKICWGNSQTPKIWFRDKNEARDVELLAESQIPFLIRMYQQEKKLSFMVVLCDTDLSSKKSGTNPNDLGTLSQPPPPRIVHGSQSQVESFRACSISDHVEYVGLDDEADYLSDSEDDFADAIGIEEDVQIDVATMLDGNVQEKEFIADKAVEMEPSITYDPYNPKIELKALFPDAKTFRSALRHFSIINHFDYKPTKSDKKRFIGKCKNHECLWRIRASKIQDSEAFMVTRLPHEHTCPATSMIDGKMVSRSWVSEKAGNWLRKNPTAGAKQVMEKLEDEFHVKVNYNKACEGRKAALGKLGGSWDESFKLLYNLKAELELTSPGSIVEIECVRVGNKNHFSKLFVALKPCIDGFILGCRPYVAVDSTILNGIYKGQLAAAIGIDGNNWLYPVAFGVFDSETKDNWCWFMTQLRKAIGNPPGLAISSDADKGLAPAIASTFPGADHRECMRHLMENFKKKFHGSVFDENMWPAAKAYTTQKCKNHMDKIKAASPQAIDYLKNNHNQLWCRNKFSELTKCDYLTNNIAESFNSWIRDLKELHLVDLVDQIRYRIMLKFCLRKRVSDRLNGVILPSVMRDLTTKSRKIGGMNVGQGSDYFAEVSGTDPDGASWRYAVELDQKKCACREWQIIGVPCIHAIAFICHIRGARLENYVDDYYSVDEFRVAYAEEIRPMNDRKMWAQNDPDFKVYPPKHKRPRGRPRNQRIRGCLEPGAKRHQCKRCKKYGHQARTCKEDGEGGTRKRKRVTTQQQDATIREGGIIGMENQ